MNAIHVVKRNRTTVGTASTVTLGSMVWIFLVLACPNVYSQGQDPFADTNGGPFVGESTEENRFEASDAPNDPFGDGRAPGGQVVEEEDRDDREDVQDVQETDEDPSQASTLSRLRDRIDVDFGDVPIQEAVQILETKAQVPIQLDTQSLDALNISTDTPTSCRLRNVPVETALQSMLRDFDLEFRVDRGIVIVTTLEEAQSNLMHQVFTVGELMHPDSETESVDQLTDALASTIEPDSWDQNGGTGSITYYQGQLIVANRYLVLREIEVLLEQLKIRIAERGGPRKVVRAPHASAQPQCGVACGVVCPGCKERVKANTKVAPGELRGGGFFSVAPTK
jgi:hypothetical protein